MKIPRSARQNNAETLEKIIKIESKIVIQLEKKIVLNLLTANKNLVYNSTSNLLVKRILNNIASENEFSPGRGDIDSKKSLKARNFKDIKYKFNTSLDYPCPDSNINNFEVKNASECVSLGYKSIKASGVRCAGDIKANINPNLLLKKPEVNQIYTEDISAHSIASISNRSDLSVQVNSILSSLTIYRIQSKCNLNPIFISENNLDLKNSLILSIVPLRACEKPIVGIQLVCNLTPLVNALSHSLNIKEEVSIVYPVSEDDFSVTDLQDMSQMISKRSIECLNSSYTQSKQLSCLVKPIISIEHFPAVPFIQLIESYIFETNDQESLLDPISDCNSISEDSDPFHQSNWVVC
jgi:hypothetical protein